MQCFNFLQICTLVVKIHKSWRLSYPDPNSLGKSSSQHLLQMAASAIPVQLKRFSKNTNLLLFLHLQPFCVFPSTILNLAYLFMLGPFPPSNCILHHLRSQQSTHHHAVIFAIENLGKKIQYFFLMTIPQIFNCSYWVLPSFLFSRLISLSLAILQSL